MPSPASKAPPATRRRPAKVEAQRFDWLLDSVEVRRCRQRESQDPALQSQLGQFLTPAPIARFMASMAKAPQGTVRVLDAGAGIGSLTAALVADLASRAARPRRIEVAAYELDAGVSDGLVATLAMCKEACAAAGIEFSGEALHEDFVAAASGMVAGGLFARPRRAFDCAILNPPYRKINAGSTERRHLQAAGVETSNLYTAFLYLAAHLLAPGGELIAITPRSFCNGPYFRPFREAFFGMMRLERLHVFESRSKAFGDDDVLQENIIIRAVKGGSTGPVHITSSASPADPDTTERVVPYDGVVDAAGGDFIVHIVPDGMNAEVARRVATLPASLTDLGIKVSTGRVVDFRATQFLRKEPTADTAPLIYPGHLANARLQWPREAFRKWNALVDCADTAPLMVPQGTYVLVKRFSSKEEARRVVATVTYADDAVHPRWGFENHLNYFHDNGGPLRQGFARGLAAYLNTSLVDTYFRQFSGHTQVNATDLRGLPYPTRAQLEAIGERVGGRTLAQDGLDALVEEILGMSKDDEGADPMKGQKRIDEALAILEALGVPSEQQNVRSALTLLALLDLKPRSQWGDASSPLRGITEMMDYFADHYGKRYAPNSRETVRRFTVHQFVEAGFVLKNPDKPTRPVNSPQAVYQVETDALELFRSFGTPAWDKKLAAFLKTMPSLQVRYARERDMERIPVKMPTGGKLTLTPGGQNDLVKSIVEEFCPRFTPGGEVLYLGDAGDKWACFDREGFLRLGIELDSHGKMPDVAIYHRAKKWLVLVEAVTSHGPVNPKRRDELKRLFKDSKAGLVFVTAFLSRTAMVKYLNDISWETEVWVADNPSHMIHFNGERFLGPYE